MAADVATLVKDATASFRTAERAFHGGKHDEVVRLGTEALAALEGADASNAQVAGILKKLRDLVAKSESRLGGTPAVPAAAPAARAAAPAARSGETPSGALVFLREIDRELDRAEKVLADGSASVEKLQSTVTAALAAVQEKLDTVMKRYGAKMGEEHPELVAYRARVAAVGSGVVTAVMARKLHAQEAKAAAQESQAASAPWLERLAPFVTPPWAPTGHDPKRYLVASASGQEEEMRERLAISIDASAALAGYEAASLAAPSDELVRVVDELRVALGAFRSSVASYGDGLVAELARKVDDAAARVDKAEYLASGILPELRQAAEGVRIYLRRDDPRPDGLLQKLDGVGKIDATLRAARVAETRMKPDAYRGAELEELRTKAAEFFHRDHPEAQVLRVTVISPDWKEESVVEYTDTTRTALRHRVTRGVTAQVAAHAGAEGTFVHTLFLSADRRADGSWQPLKGHVMYRDPMLAENVNA